MLASVGVVVAVSVVLVACALVVVSSSVVMSTVDDTGISLVEVLLISVVVAKVELVDNVVFDVEDVVVSVVTASEASEDVGVLELCAPVMSSVKRNVPRKQARHFLDCARKYSR